MSGKLYRFGLLGLKPLALRVSHVEGRKHLPVVELRAAA
jgi:hypothetical protein